MSRPPTRRSVLAAGLGALTLPAAGCGVTRSETAGRRRLRMMIPNSPGGGYDTTGRAVVKVLEDEALTGRFEVFNVIGASGTVAMTRLLNERENQDLLMTMGLGVVGATYTNRAAARVSAATPVARLIEEQQGVVVPARSPWRDLRSFLAAWKADPRGTTVGGGSAPGGPDHLFPMELAGAVGLDPRRVNYISYDGGGDLLPALLGAKVDAATTGLGEFEESIRRGQVRVLATSGATAVRGIAAPTLRASGVDLVFTNWRGVLAPPGIPDARRRELIDLLTRMSAGAAWKDVLARKGWTGAFLPGEQFGAFLRAQDQRVGRTLTGLGLS